MKGPLTFAATLAAIVVAAILLAFGITAVVYEPKVDACEARNGVYHEGLCIDEEVVLR